MNATRIYSPLRHLASPVLFVGFALTTPSLCAQTFAGRDYLTESPVSVQAFIYPDAPKTALKIRLENRTAEAVRVSIVNEDGKTLYDDYIVTPTYYGRFDLSALPRGTYRIELSNRTTRLNQPFRMEPSTTSRMAMVTRLLKPNKPASDTLTMNFPN